MANRSAERSWTTERDLRLQVKRLWDRGAILADMAGGGGMFPKRLVLKRPTAVELRDHFASARDWSSSLLQASNIRLTMRHVRHRVLGTNSVPHEAWVESREDAATIIGKRRELERFGKLLALVGKRQPGLLPWIAKKPMRALEPGARLGRPSRCRRVGCSGTHGLVIYLRQMDVAGVDTKFVHSHRGVLAELLDLALPPESVDGSQKGAARFESRFGFRTKPERIRIRFSSTQIASAFHGPRKGAAAM